MGAQFTQDPSGNLHLTREGGHTARRIVHAADATGAEIARTLTSAARNHPSITLLEHHMCVDLVVSEFDGAPHCVGIDVLNLETHDMLRVVALSTLLASGGAGQLYPSTTNPAVATGDGIAMAWRAGAAVGNMEFIQFHPTSLAAPPRNGRAFLITEAVRGEGGRLFNLGGERFMPEYDSRAELAPRDVVARAIHDQISSRRDPHVLLDISHKPRSKILSAFPSIVAKCMTLGIDITRDPIPVIPAQHYICGGVETGLLAETRIQGLFACGEVAFTGVHGANRLASNSLLEALVFGARAVKPAIAHAEHAAQSCNTQLKDAAENACFPRGRFSPPSAKIQAWVDSALAELRATMWRSAGIVRDISGMEAGLAQVEALEREVALVASCNMSRPVLELRNLVTCGRLVLESGLARHESRGLHFCKDFPVQQLNEAHPTRLKPLRLSSLVHA
jgi:L-aspartate oxidase